jgi:hypothetical protein
MSDEQGMPDLDAVTTVDFEIESQVSENHLGGDRIVVAVKGGKFAGPMLSGVVRSGSDWAVRRADGVLQVDVRAQLLTDDGIMILLRYNGVAVAAPAGMRVQAHARFEAPLTSRYANLNDKICVALGAVGRGTVTYRVLALR